jgi:hypothetical protein
MSDALSALIDRYEAGGPLLAYAVSGLSREHELARPGPGAWSIAEVVAHLTDSDLVGTDRMKRVIAQPEPTLLAYDENAWVASLGYEELPLVEEVALFTASRNRMARILRRVRPEHFARWGDHTERGRETLADLLVGYAEHLDHHLKFLYAKRGNLGVAIYPRYSREPEK